MVGAVENFSNHKDLQLQYFVLKSERMRKRLCIRLIFTIKRFRNVKNRRIRPWLR